MNKKIRIAIDAMGGENSPRKIIDGIEMSLKDNIENYFYIFGRDEILKKIIKPLHISKHTKLIKIKKYITMLIAKSTNFIYFLFCKIARKDENFSIY